VVGGGWGCFWILLLVLWVFMGVRHPLTLLILAPSFFPSLILKSIAYRSFCILVFRVTRCNFGESLRTPRPPSSLPFTNFSSPYVFTPILPCPESRKRFRDLREDGVHPHKEILRGMSMPGDDLRVRSSLFRFLSALSFLFP